MRSCRIFGSLKFYVAEEKSLHYKKGAGLYVGDSFDYKNTYKKLNDTEILRIYEWLSRYINKHINNRSDNLSVSAKAHARSIIRALDAMEAKNEKANYRYRLD